MYKRQAQDTLASTKAEEAAFKRQLDQANERFDVGLSDKTDVLEAQAGFDTARANRLLAERAVDDAFEALVTLTNRDYLAVEGIVHTLPVLAPTPNDAKAWVDTAAAQNLNLQASLYAVTAAEENLRQRKAGHAPTLDAVASYQTVSYTHLDVYKRQDRADQHGYTVIPGRRHGFAAVELV